MDMTKLQYFITIVEEGGITKAALKLNMTQPPLSMSLKKFEKELGFHLFERTGKRLTLTPSGQIIYDQGKELIYSSNAIIEEAKEQIEGKKGFVTVGCSTIANISIIPLIVEEMKKREMNITVKVLEGNTAFILDQLRAHKMDLGFIRNIIDKDDFNTEPLIYEPLYIALPSNHQLYGQESVSLNELKYDDFLMPYTTLGFGISEFILEGCEAYGFTPNVIYWGTETLPMLEMVKRSLGVAFVPALFKRIESFALPKLAKLENFEIRASLNLATLKNSVNKSATEKFLSVTKDVINDLKLQIEKR